MFRSKIVAIVLLGLLVGAGCRDRTGTTGGGGGGSPAGATGPVIIGAYLSMTGSKADFGIQTERGARMAIEEANRAGGVHGRQIELVVLDDQGKADEAGNAVTRLIDVNNAAAILGEVSSSLSLVGGRIAQRRGVPMVSPSSTNTQVTEIGDNVFRVCFIDPFQGYVMAKFARETLHLERVAILKDVRNDYSIGLARAFHDEFIRMGGSISGEESYNEGDTDFSAQLTTIKGTNPQAIFVPGYYSEAGNVARQARRLGLAIPLLGGDGWDSPQLRQIGGPDIVGSFYSNHFAPDNLTPRSRAFVDAYRARHHEMPSGLAALGYDAALVIIDAMKRAPTVDRAAIRAALRTTNVAAVTGTIAFDANRNPVKPAVVLRVTDTGDRFEAQVEPRAN